MKDNYPSIFVTRDAPLIIKDPSATMHYETVYMDLGAYIEIRAGSVLEIETLAPVDEMTGDAQSGCTAYQTLKESECRQSWSHHIILTGEPGKNGLKGEDGRDWGQSGDKGTPAETAGGNAPGTFTIIIRELKFHVTILSIGGAGGKGGDGGKGADGHDGSSSSKPGGIGGDGGDGGVGSNGGNAASVLTVKYTSSGGFVPTIDCTASTGGAGGQGGNHGRNGTYYGGTSQPKNGANGSSGISGQKGSFKIEKL